MSCKVIVVGAGWAGLVTAKTYLQVDPSIDLIVLESEDTLGGTWSASRIYPELNAQQPYGQYETSEMSLERMDDPPQAGNYIPSRRLHDYLNKYAEEWGIKDKIRFNSTVERCQRASDGIKWEVYFQGRNEGEQPLVCDKLIIATGLTSQTNVPDIPSQNFTPLTFHSRYTGKYYASLQSKDVETVCVYGGGKSAYDAVAAAANNGKRVHWIIRGGNGGGAGAFFKPELFGRPAGDSAFTPVYGALTPDITNTTSWSYRFLHSGRSWLGSQLSWWLWGWLSRKTLEGWRYDETENMRKLKPEVYDHSIFWFARTPYSVADETIIDIIREGKRITVHKAAIKRLSGKQVHLDDGTTLETDMLIYATGWQNHLSIFSEKDSLALGLPVPIERLPSLDPKVQYPSDSSKRAREQVLQLFPRFANPPIAPRTPQYTQFRLYQFIAPLPMVKNDDRSLAFVGYLSVNGTSILFDTMALWAVGWMTGKMNINRNIEDIEREVDLYNAYMRVRYLTGGLHTPLLAYEWFSIVKKMLAELNVPLPQKSTLEPWFPPDYRGMVDKWMKLHSSKPKAEGRS
ncbi:FAD/NAD(P)-binding domain-containing protein [Serendipita vermifera]|nr:FAD/NAD(P)-binding domain-containing protein [Serendipita vermifera]